MFSSRLLSLETGQLLMGEAYERVLTYEGLSYFTGSHIHTSLV